VDIHNGNVNQTVAVRESFTMQPIWVQVGCIFALSFYTEVIEVFVLLKLEKIIFGAKNREK